MRRSIGNFTAILSLTLVAAARSQAQAPAAPDQDHSGPPHHGEWHHHEPSPEFETKMLSKRLKLSAEQEAAITPIFTEREERMKALRPTEGSQPDFKAMHEQRKIIEEDIKSKLDAVLTPEQKDELEAMHQHQFHGGPNGEHGPHPPPPPGV